MFFITEIIINRGQIYLTALAYFAHGGSPKALRGKYFSRGFQYGFGLGGYFFLTLILSCLAAMQAPVILMSQNRQEVRDRLQAEHDYRINLKAELEIRHLHEKIDHLLMNQWQRLMEIQQIQMELMEELAHKKRRERTE